MYKILLVDDEKLVLKSLEFSVDWESHGFEIVGTANSAMEALEKIDLLSPDVVFTDIRMPDISGLELLQMIRQKNQNIYCVIISGYAEFGYVKKAMELESVGYCLKPFDSEEIEKYLKRIKKKLDKKTENHIQAGIVADYIMRRDKASIAYMEKFYHSRGILFDEQELIAVCILGLDDMNDITCTYALPIGRQKHIFLVRQEEKDAFFRKLNFLAGKIKLHVGFSKRIMCVQDAPKEIREAHRCAYQFFCEGDWVWLKEAPAAWNDRNAVKEFQKQLHQGEKGIREGFDLLRKHFKNGSCSIEAAVMVRNIVEMTWADSDTESEFTWNYDMLLDEYQHIETMLDNLEEQCLFMMNTQAKNAITNRIFRDIYSFVNESFQQPITASSIAEQFHINNCYVSQLFRKELGKTFTEFLTEKRIQFACSLLRKSDLNVNEISEQAGFSDYAYFSRVFRKMMNCTPTEYRLQG